MDRDENEQDERRGPTTEIMTVEASTAALVSRQEIDIQIATARSYPRSIGQFLQTAKQLALSTEEVAEECVYALKRGATNISGPSIRFAEIIQYAWGNCRAGARMVREDAEFITAQGVFHDLERNVAYTVEIQRRIVGSNGKRYGVDMIGVTGNAAASIALRNAILKGVPAAIWRPVYEEARALIAGTYETLDRRKAKALSAFQKIGATEEQVLALIGRKGVKDIEPDDMIVLRGTLTAIRDGDTNFDAVFGRQDKAKEKVDLKETMRQGREKNGTAAEGTKGEPEGKADGPVAEAKKGSEGPDANTADSDKEHPAADAGAVAEEPAAREARTLRDLGEWLDAAKNAAEVHKLQIDFGKVKPLSKDARSDGDRMIALAVLRVNLIGSESRKDFDRHVLTFRQANRNSGGEAFWAAANALIKKGEARFEDKPAAGNTARDML